MAAVLALSLAGCGGPAERGAAVSGEASGGETDVTTVAVRADLVVSQRLPDEVVYDILTAILEDTSLFGSESDSVGVETAASVKSVPYHAGAAGYYAEAGYAVDAVMEAADTADPAGDTADTAATAGDAADTAATAGDTADAAAAGADEVRELTIATGNSSGMYYAAGTAMAEAIEAKTGIPVTVLSTGGSQSNLEAIEAGEADIGFVQADVLHYAWNGERLFEGSPVSGFAVAAALYPEAVQIITLNPDIRTVSDLRGRKVSIGEAGSGVYYNALDVLDAYDMTEEDIVAVYQSFSTVSDSLYDGIIDAAFIVAGFPTAAVSDLAELEEVILLPVDGDEGARLLESSEYYEEIIIPAGTYGETGEDPE